jgi:hypothetical protein
LTAKRQRVSAALGAQVRSHRLAPPQLASSEPHAQRAPTPTLVGAPRLETFSVPSEALAPPVSGLLVECPSAEEGEQQTNTTESTTNGASSVTLSSQDGSPRRRPGRPRLYRATGDHGVAACERCPQVSFFSSQGNYRRHLRRVHGEEPERLAP